MPASFAGANAAGGIVSGSYVSNYNSTNLGNITIDSRSLSTNYNVLDNYAKAEENMTRAGFEWTLRDNLLLAKTDASEADMCHALAQACALDFVNALPQQLDTNIGEKGIRLSQGEKQRLTIARVLLKNPPFVILDEAQTLPVAVLEEMRGIMESDAQQRLLVVGLERPAPDDVRRIAERRRIQVVYGADQERHAVDPGERRKVLPAD